MAIFYNSQHNFTSLKTCYDVYIRPCCIDSLKRRLVCWFWLKMYNSRFTSSKKEGFQEYTFCFFIFLSSSWSREWESLCMQPLTTRIWVQFFCNSNYPILPDSYNIGFKASYTWSFIKLR